MLGKSAGIPPSPSPSTSFSLRTKPSAGARAAGHGRQHPGTEGGCWRRVGCGGAFWGGAREVSLCFFHPVALFWKRQEFRKPACGECQVRLYRSQAPACFLVLLEPVSDLISLGGSCLINTHLAARGPHRPDIVSLPAPSVAGGAPPAASPTPPGSRAGIQVAPLTPSPWEGVCAGGPGLGRWGLDLLGINNLR